jgi:hypothetical protein
VRCERTLPVFPTPSYTTPLSTHHSQYEKAPLSAKYATTAGSVYGLDASQLYFQSK